MLDLNKLDLPEGAMTIGSVMLTHFIDEDGDPCYGIATEGEIDALAAIGYLEVIKTRFAMMAYDS